MQTKEAHPRFTHRSVQVFWAILVCATLTRAAQYGPADTGKPTIGNFGQINEHYYRGGRLDIAGIIQLKDLGVRCVIDLQESGNRIECAWAREAGMRYYKIPLSSKRPATSAQTEYFLSLVNDPANWPVYVHCAGGRHRTGEMTAIHRITHDSWTADDAYQEMKKFDYYSNGGHGPLKDYVYRFYQTHRPAAATPVSR